MNIATGDKPIVTLAPRCPQCDSADTGIRRSQGLYVEHRGEKCRAQKQYRTCRCCGHNFGVIHIKGPVRALRRLAEQKPSAKAATRQTKKAGKKSAKRKR